MAKPSLIVGNGGSLPSSSKFRYHQAARDGYLDLLKGATRRDCDRPDEDGMTPAMWAAYHGNLEALRLIVARGGNPDKGDLLGNTCLHHAVIHGHLTCVSFLVTFGANIWAMDNDFRTPLDLAGLHNHMDIVKYMDTVAGSETAKDQKAVTKIKQKSYDRAVENVKRYRRLQAETTKKIEKEHEKLMQQSNEASSSAGGHGGGGGKSKFGTVTSLNIFSDSKSFLAKSIRGLPGGGKKHATFSSTSAVGEGCPKSFSDISGIQATVRRDRKTSSTSKTGNAASSSSNGLDANSKKIKWKGSLDFAVGGGGSGSGGSGSSESGSLSATPTTPPRRGLIRDFQVMYVDKAASKNGISMDPDAMEEVLNRATSEPDLVMSGDSGIMEEEEDEELPPSIFDRKGFGELAFFRHRPPQVVQESAFKDALLSLPVGGEAAAAGEADAITDRSEASAEGVASCKMSVSSGGDVGLPWDVDALLEDLDDDVNDNGTNTPLEAFLAAHGLRNFLGVLAAEKIDLESLCLCSDADLKEIGVPLGPRRKILDVVAKRKESLLSPGTICDARH